MPWLAMRTFSNVKSSPMIPRQPDVPNLIILRRRTLAQRGGFLAVFAARNDTCNDPSRMERRPLILIADDEEDVVQLLKVYLRPLDAEFLVAGDGEEALAVAQARLPDVVLL